MGNQISDYDCEFVYTWHPLTHERVQGKGPPPQCKHCLLFPVYLLTQRGNWLITIVW